MSEFASIPALIRQQFTDIAQIAYELEAENPLLLDLTSCEHASSSYLFIAAAKTQVQRRALLAKVRRCLGQKYNLHPYNNSRTTKELEQWLLLDYGEFMLHILAPEARNFYNLEALWQGYPSYTPDFVIRAGVLAEVAWKTAGSDENLQNCT